MKKIGLGQIFRILANLGVIAGIVFLGVELQQNNALLGAQARATRAQVRMDGTDLALSSPELMRAFAREQSGESLSELDQMYLNLDGTNTGNASALGMANTGERLWESSDK